MGASGRAALALTAVLGICSPLASAAETSGDDGEPYYVGNAVPRRNFPPPTTGCTVMGKVWSPLSPDPALPHSSRVSWDFCQDLCNKSSVTLPSGLAVACAHFAFFPDGKCYLQGPDAVLQEAERCNGTSPCDHGFQVVSGPADCAQTSMWAVPPAGSMMVSKVPPEKMGPAVVGEGEKCNGSLPPPHATFCAEGLTCVTDGARGETGVCQKTGPHIVGEGEKCNGSLPPPHATFCAPGLVCATGGARGETGVCEKATPSTTAEPLPEGATIVGYYYEPHTMNGTAKTSAPSWRACMELCAADPGCGHFGYWPDGGCHQQTPDAKLVKAKCDDTEPDCDGLKVISGPRDLGDKSLWPVLGAKVEERLPPPPEVPHGEVVVRAAGPGSGAAQAQNGMPMMYKVGAGLFCIGVIVAAALYGYMRGRGDDDTDREYDDDFDEEDFLDKPLKG